MYVNLELDRASCLHRFKDVYTSMGIAPENLQNIDIWNLRGKSVPMDKLAPKLIRRAAKKDYVAIIIDPIYKVKVIRLSPYEARGEASYFLCPK